MPRDWKAGSNAICCGVFDASCRAVSLKNNASHRKKKIMSGEKFSRFLKQIRGCNLHKNWRYSQKRIVFSSLFIVLFITPFCAFHVKNAAAQADSIQGFRLGILDKIISRFELSKAGFFVFPWPMFLPAITGRPKATVPCSDDHAAASTTRESCLQLRGYWYQAVSTCSCYETTHHPIVGKWKDEWDEHFITYSPDGTYSATEFGLPYHGTWVPVSATIVWRFDAGYVFAWTLIMTSPSTYIYKEAPSLGTETRIE